MLALLFEAVGLMLVGFALGVVVTTLVRSVAAPLTARAMATRGLTQCPECEGAGRVVCLVCSGRGAYRDVTAEHLAAQAEKHGATGPWGDGG